MLAIDWMSVVLVSGLQMALFWRGIGGIRNFLNLAAPAVYAVMLVLPLLLWHRAGADFVPKVNALMAGSSSTASAPIRLQFSMQPAM